MIAYVCVEYLLKGVSILAEKEEKSQHFEGRKVWPYMSSTKVSTFNAACMALSVAFHESKSSGVRF